MITNEEKISTTARIRQALRSIEQTATGYCSEGCPGNPASLVSNPGSGEWENPRFRFRLLLQGLHTKNSQQLEQINRWVVEEAFAAVQTGNIGFLRGGASLLQYLNIMQNRIPELRLILQDLLQQVARSIPEPETYLSLTMADGRTGWTLALIRSLQTQNIELRISRVVHELRFWIEEQLASLRAAQLPIDSAWNQYSFFPFETGNQGEILVSNELNWSRGDLNHALVLYEASSYLDQPELSKWADHLCHFSIYRRKHHLLEVQGAGILEGMAGLALLYRRLYQCTQQQLFQAEYVYWITTLLDWIEHPDYRADPTDFLTGMPGIRTVLETCLEPSPALELFFM